MEEADKYGIQISPVKSATALRGYACETPELVGKLKQEKVQVMDMECSFLIDALVQKGIDTSVIQIPQDVFSQDKEVSRSFSAGKQNVNESYTAALTVAMYALK